MYFFVRTPQPKGLTVRIHPSDTNLRGRRGATIIVPVGIQERSELKEHLEIINERNPGRERLTGDQIEAAIEKKAKGTERPLSVSDLQALGLKPGERRKIVDAQEKLRDRKRK